MMAEMALDAVPVRTTEDEVASLFREHYRPLVRLASLLLGDVHASEEVVQDAFVKLQVGWGGIRDKQRTPAWLRSAVLNGARSRMRRTQVQRRHLEVVPGSVASAETDAVVADDHRRMIELLRRLPDRQREALALRFYLDLSEAEMAAAMGVSTGSVKTHVHRGLAALQAALGEDR